MNNQRVNSKLLCGMILCAFVPLSIMAGEKVSQTIGIDSDGLVRVENVAGEIEIGTWDKDEVSVEANLGDEAEGLEVSETANGVLIRVKNRSNHHQMDGSDLVIMIPGAASLEVESVSADIIAEGPGGETANLVSVSGDIELQASAGRVEIQSVSGDVEYAGLSSRTQMETVSGTIAVSGISGEVSMQTVSGDISLTTESIERGRFEAVSGDLELELGIDGSGRLNVDNMSGDVILNLPADQSLSIAAQTFSGDIRSDFGEAEQTSFGPGSVLEFDSGGGATVKLESFSGDIQIRRR